MKTHGEIARELIETDFFKGIKYYKGGGQGQWLEPNIRWLELMEIERYVLDYLKDSGRDDMSFVNAIIKTLKALLFVR